MPRLSDAGNRAGLATELVWREEKFENWQKILKLVFSSSHVSSAHSMDGDQVRVPSGCQFLVLDRKK